MRNFLDEVNKRIVVLDGAMGTELERRGMPAGYCHELWNVEQPETVREIHRSYIQAGADAVLTNTFGGSRLKLAAYDLADRAYEINLRATEIARLEAGDDHFVLGDIGPTGLFMEPLGKTSQSEFHEAFAEQVAAFVEGGVDAVIVQTMSAVEEAVAAVRAAKETSSLPVLGLMGFKRDADGEGFHSVMGVDIQRAVNELSEAGADILGTNCWNALSEICEIIRRMRRLTQKPLAAEPNAGQPKLVDGKTVFDESPEKMAGGVQELVAAGARVIGGCCGTTPDHLRLIVSRIRQLE
jgi:5-methyltetrahydrofolate--homocysteine methyltransferase